MRDTRRFDYDDMTHDEQRDRFDDTRSDRRGGRSFDERSRQRGYGQGQLDQGYGQGQFDQGWERRQSGQGVEYGRRGDFAGRGPKNFRRSDDRIKDDVGTKLTRDSSIDASDIEIEVTEALVVLRGTVDDRDQKRRAEDIAESVAGVNDVRNELRVQRSNDGDRWRTSAMTGGASGVGETRGDYTPRSTRQYATVVGVFRDMSIADRAINELKSMGFSREDLSFITKDSGMSTKQGGTTGAESKGATTGAVVGGLGGGAIGWLLGIGALAIPGVGPVVAAGALATAIAGAAAGAVAGGFVGALVGVGVPEDEAKEYERLVKDGGVLVTVACQDDNEKDRAKKVLDRYEAQKVNDFTGEQARDFSTNGGNGRRREQEMVNTR